MNTMFDKNITKLYSAKRMTKPVNFHCAAPSAQSVYIVGDFNWWNPTSHPMRCREDGWWFVRSEKTHSARQGQTLLQAAEQCGVNIPSGCRQGQCGTCKIKLLEGAVSMDVEQGLPHNLKKQGYVLTCVGYAKGPIKLDV
jgi:ferredoxin